MNTRRSWMALVGGCAWGLMLAGCSALNHNGVRAKDQRVPREWDEEARGDASVESPAEMKETKGFFHPTRRPGALSSEAGDIERNLLGGR